MDKCASGGRQSHGTLSVDRENSRTGNYLLLCPSVSGSSVPKTTTFVQTKDPTSLHLMSLGGGRLNGTHLTTHRTGPGPRDRRQGRGWRDSLLRTLGHRSDTRTSFPYQIPVSQGSGSLTPLPVDTTRDPKVLTRHPSPGRYGSYSFPSTPLLKVR